MQTPWLNTGHCADNWLYARVYPPNQYMLALYAAVNIDREYVVVQIGFAEWSEIAIDRAHINQMPLAA